MKRIIEICERLLRGYCCSNKVDENSSADPYSNNTRKRNSFDHEIQMVL